MARKATGKSKRSTTKSKMSRKPARKTARRATARPKTAPPKKSSGRPASRSTGRSSGKSSGDFGIPVMKRQVAAAVAQETKFRPAGDHREDPRQPRSGVDSRTAGVGMRDAGPGSDSGGDVDPDIIGLGSGASPGGQERPLSQPRPDSAANLAGDPRDLDDIE